MSNVGKISKEERILGLLAYGEAFTKNEANEMHAIANVPVRQRQGLQMKHVLAASSLMFVASLAGATPTPAAVEACMGTRSIPGKALYTGWTPAEFARADEDGGSRKEVLRIHGGELVGLWRNSREKAWGLSYNDRDIAQQHIVKLDKKQAPYEFEPYKAQWGELKAGAKRYVCITFNFDGIGRSGRFQDIRGVYLIEMKKGPARAYYTAGNISTAIK